MNLKLINENISSLNEKDEQIAIQMLSERRLHDLKDLVDSAYIIQRRKDKAPENMAEKILKLKGYVDAYLMNIDPAYFGEEYEDFDNSDSDWAFIEND